MIWYKDFNGESHTIVRNQTIRKPKASWVMGLWGHGVMGNGRRISANEGQSMCQHSMCKPNGRRETQLWRQSSCCLELIVGQRSESTTRMTRVGPFGWWPSLRVAVIRGRKRSSRWKKMLRIRNLVKSDSRKRVSRSICHMSYGRFLARPSSRSLVCI